MKNATVNSASGVPTEKQLEQINRFSRKTLAESEVYVFSILLCDNEVDRDFERFSVESLHKLKELFIGKTGIFDHSHTAKNQCARIFDTEVEVAENLTENGENYTCLKAYAYTVRTKENESLITDIDAGIKKEISIGCAISRKICSICGEDAENCIHRKGKSYSVNGKRKMCVVELREPTDAYEWSFVAVPAQIRAGVTKSFKGEAKMNIEELLKSFEENGEVTLTENTAKQIKKDYEAMKKLNTAAKEFLEVQKSFILKNLCRELDQKTASIFQSVMEKMTAEELFALYKNAEKTTDTVVSQIKKQTKSGNKNLNRDFIV